MSVHPNKLNDQIFADVGAVTIGRNEGERLRRCLGSLVGKVAQVVYVDSASTDGSVEMARRMGVEVIELDLERAPFTAPRARNEGFEQLMELKPELKYVQFLDGDCCLVDGWLEASYQTMESDPSLAIVSGRRREIYPERSLYNRLSDAEWDTPVGEAKSCHGDHMMRVEAFKEVSGYNPTVMTGEEAEMCFRLRQKSWRIFRIDKEMSLHDVAMTRFSQWWNRHRRSGFNFAELAWMHGRSSERLKVRIALSVVFWGLCMPLVIVVAAYPSQGISLLLLLGYLLPIFRSAKTRRARGYHLRLAWTCGFFDVLAKFPQLFGIVQFLLRKVLRGKIVIIEYKK